MISLTSSIDQPLPPPPLIEYEPELEPQQQQQQHRRQQIHQRRLLPQPQPHQHQQQQEPIECAICMEELDSTKNFAKTNCGHSFCLTCLMRSLKNNNTCPMCRTNIEEEKPMNPNIATLDECVDLIKDELDMFPFRDHVDAITMFDNPISSLKNTLRVFALGLSKSIIFYQNWEELDDEEEDEDVISVASEL
tara:strand:+ start:354 stop:929 length:576 start_codon:yes stop_codon:yes gene_type:complete